MSTMLHSHTDIAFICDGLAVAGGAPQAVQVSSMAAAGHPAQALAQKSVPGILVLDTCVLLSNVLRRVLLRLAAQGCFIPVWSERIGSEWRRNAARIWDVPLSNVEQQWAALQQAFPLADQGDVQAFESGLRRSDPKDWHVIAAGRAAKQQHPGQTAAIVTRNIKDFNRTELRGYGLTLLDPDELLVRLHIARPALIQAVIPAIPAMAAAPGQEPADLETILKRERLFRLNRIYRSPT